MQARRFWIVTPSFNSLPWLPCAVASVADQACGEVEVHHHVQDGGSKDGTREWLEKHAEECAANPRPGYTFSYESAPDAGMYDAINKGWSQAPQGVDFLAHLNSDEQYLPGALKRVATRFEETPAVEVLLGGMIVTDLDGGYICHRRSLRPIEFVFRHTTGGMTAATFLRLSVFSVRGVAYDTDWRVIADKVWYYQMFQKSIKMACINDLVSVFMETGNNLGWSEASIKEAQRYADTYLGGQVRGINFCKKWNGVRRLVKELFLQAPKDYALYRPGNSERTVFPISRPAILWGKTVHAKTDENNEKK